MKVSNAKKNQRYFLKATFTILKLLIKLKLTNTLSKSSLRVVYTSRSAGNLTNSKQKSSSLH